MTPLEALEALETAAKTVDGVRVFALDEVVDPPGVVVEPPELTPRTACAGYTDAKFTVNIVVAMQDARRVVEALLALVDAVTVAIEDSTRATVTNGVPGTYTTGGGELPAYQLTVEVPL